MDLIRFVYGKDVELYRDVLHLTSTDASDDEIQAAFVAQRFELFKAIQELRPDSSSKTISMVDEDGFMVTLTQRQFAEKKMDALVATFRLLSDAEKRQDYNASIRVKRAMSSREQQRKSSSGRGERSSGSGSSPRREYAKQQRHIIDDESSSYGSASMEEEQQNQGFQMENGSGWSPSKSVTNTEQNVFLRSNTKKKLFDDSPTHSNSNRSNKSTPTSRSRKSLNLDTTNTSSSSAGFSTEEGESVSEGTRTETSEDDYTNATGLTTSHSLTPTTKTDYDDETFIGPYFQYQGCQLSKWLRSNQWKSQADLIDDVGQEIYGSASDFVLAFSQVFNAFKIDGHAIDHMSENISVIAEDISNNAYRRK